MIKGDVGTQVLTVDHGDWDHHTDLGTLGWGRMVRQAGSLATNLGAFLTDLGGFADKVTVVVLSEFGRRVKENANYGLDHGYGNVMLLLGAGVRGGRYYGRWPGLDAQVDSDLTVTTDYRAVLWEVVAARFDAGPAAVFPQLQPGGVARLHDRRLTSPFWVSRAPRTCRDTRRHGVPRRRRDDSPEPRSPDQLLTPPSVRRRLGVTCLDRPGCEGDGVVLGRDGALDWR